MISHLKLVSARAYLELSSLAGGWDGTSSSLGECNNSRTTPPTNAAVVLIGTLDFTRTGQLPTIPSDHVPSCFFDYEATLLASHRATPPFRGTQKRDFGLPSRARTRILLCSGGNSNPQTKNNHAPHFVFKSLVDNANPVWMALDGKRGPLPGVALAP